MPTNITLKQEIKGRTLRTPAGKGRVAEDLAKESEELKPEERGVYFNKEGVADSDE